MHKILLNNLLLTLTLSLTLILPMVISNETPVYKFNVDNSEERRDSSISQTSTTILSQDESFQNDW